MVIARLQYRHVDCWKSFEIPLPQIVNQQKFHSRVPNVLSQLYCESDFSLSFHQQWRCSAVFSELQ